MPHGRVICYRCKEQGITTEFEGNYDSLGWSITGPLILETKSHKFGTMKDIKIINNTSMGGHREFLLVPDGDPMASLIWYFTQAILDPPLEMCEGAFKNLDIPHKPPKL